MRIGRARSTLRVETRVFSVAELGPESPLPPVGAPLEVPYRITGAIPQEIIDGAGYGNPPNLYPYQAQDGYGRRRSPRELHSVVLENDALRAVFLPELGGRLWELVDKTTGKQLLHTGPAIQFANLALRNAWFAGGIEWNIGTRGHSPTTCSPLHAAIVRTGRQEVLRMWEFDRLREVVFQIDAWLPPDSAVLLVAIRIRNPNPDPVPMYWWSNAAVPEGGQTRIVAPADSAFASDYTQGLSRVAPTADGGIDGTWPANNPGARDFFFDLAPQTPPWILAADGDGDGLAMLSTGRLRGRKLFVWGEGAGGHRWQEWLTPGGGRYAEIQAGLAQTQFQHLVMPGSAEWSWVEAYGNARVDPDLAHGTDWGAAVAHCAGRVAALASPEDLEAALEQSREWADAAPGESITVGTGWGALESLRRARSRQPWIEVRGTPFAEATMTLDQEPWRDLLNGSRFRGAATFVRGTDWEALLQDQEVSGPTLLHLATLKHARGQFAAARVLYLETLAVAPGERAIAALAHRGLAMIAPKPESIAVEHHRAACALDPENTSLLIETATALLATGDAEEALDLLEHADAHILRRGRIRFLLARAFADAGSLEKTARILREGIEVADLREGENSLAALWRRACPGVPVPTEYEFGMT